MATESLVDACRRGLGLSLPDDAFEIVNGDYYTYRERSLELAA